MSRILAITEASEDPEVRVWGRITLARQLYEEREDLDRAYELMRTLEIPDSVENAYSLRRDRWGMLGRISLQIGRMRESAEAYRRQVEMAVAAGDRYLEASSRYQLAWVAYEKLREAPTPSRRAEVIALAQEALDVAAMADNASVEALAGWILGVLTPGPEGRELLEHCYELAESAKYRSHCLNPLAGRIAATDLEEAKRLLVRSRELVRGSEEPIWEAHVWQETMRLDWKAKPPEEALASSELALGIIEDLRDRQPRGSATQAGVFSIWSDDYAWLAGRLLEEAGRGFDRDRAIAEAFRVSERMRARALTDWLRRTDPEATGTAIADFAGLGEVRAALQPGEALLSFQVAPWEGAAGDFGGGSWLLVVTRRAVSVHRLPGRVDLRRGVKVFNGLIERRDGSEADFAAHLYVQLLAPALEELPAGIGRLILIPDDALHRLPFAALRAAPGGALLGLRFQLVRAPSATLWLRWRQESGRRGRSRPEYPLLVVADPELPADEGGPDGVQVAQVRDAARGLGRLPHARREGRRAIRALGSGLLLTGPEASEAALVSRDLREVGMLHFAAHAVSDEARPERSAVLLAPGDGGHDGRLQSAEIAGLDLHGMTVVLASCRSASGTVLRGEGVMSLGRAFFQGGAHGVVASLWPLRDDESAARFSRFYRRLAAGVTVAEALHTVRREAIAAGEPAAAWAGLVVLGDGSEAPVPGGHGPAQPPGMLFSLLATTVALLAASAWLLIRRVRARNAPIGRSARGRHTR